MGRFFYFIGGWVTVDEALQEILCSFVFCTLRKAFNQQTHKIKNKTFAATNFVKNVAF